MLHSTTSQEKIISSSSSLGINFKFIPPRAPHFGGLWEAAVKSAKHLLLRSVGSASLTYEEFETAIVEIEAILNSRPLTPMSNDPSDLSALTPGHFLIGEALTAQVDHQSNEFKGTLQHRWKTTAHIKQEFWERWSKEYLNQLQSRYKWKERSNNVVPGMMVVIKEDNVPVMQWPLGRIVNTYEGIDGAVRVADVKTSTGVSKRAIHRLAPLPIDTSDEQSTSNTKEAQIRTSDEATTDRKKRPRLSKISSLATTLLTALLLLPTVLTSSVTVTRFQPNAWMHFENIGTVNRISTQWNIIVYYRLQPIQDEINVLRDGTNSLRKLCERIEQPYCNMLINHFDQTFKELQLENRLIQPNRQKRGAVDIIGNVAHSLFGLLDANYAQDMAKTIDKVTKNEHHIIHLLKNQTSVIDSTINIIKHQSSQIDENLEIISNRVNKFQEVTQEHAGILYITEIKQRINSLSIQLEMIVANLHRTYSSILDVLTDSHHGQISSILLSPQQLEIEVSKIREHLPPTLQLPTQSEELLNLYNLMTSSGGLTSEHIIFNIQIPILDVNSFDLFNIIPIPTIGKSGMISIEPTCNVMAFNAHRDQYFPVSAEALTQCKNILDERYMCPHIQAIYNKGAEKCACEVHVFNNESHSRCLTHELRSESKWIELKHKNRWIYGTTKPLKLSIVCAKSSSQIVVQNSGMIELDPECSIKHELVTIHSTTHVNSTISQSYTADVTILDTTNTTHYFKPFAPILLHKEISTVNEFEKQQHNLKMNQPIDISDIPTIHYHHFIVEYLAIGIGIALLIWMISTRYKNQQPKSKPENSYVANPQPLRRQEVQFQVREE